jgi:hypothetical protein
MLLVVPLLVPSLRFQLRHAFAPAEGVRWTPLGAAAAIGAALGAQVLLWSPWVVASGLHGLRASGDAADRALVGTLSAAVFLSALIRAVPPEPNWWAPAAIVVLVAAARHADDLAPRRQLAMLALAIAPTAVAIPHTLRPFLPLGPEADPTARLHGWRSGDAPSRAPGIGPYGPAAERCVYQGDCIEIRNYFRKLNANLESASRGIVPR